MAVSATLSGVEVDVSADLSTLQDVRLPDGTDAWVKASGPTHGAWRLDKGSSVAVDGRTSVATLSGAGRWLWFGAGDGSPLALAEPRWFVSPTGDDRNAGTSSTSPLRSLAELRRRLGPRPAWTIPRVDVVFLGDLGDVGGVPDPFLFEPVVTPTTIVVVSGTRTQVATGTFTAVTPRAPPAPLTVVDATQDWAAHLDLLVTITSSTDPTRVDAAAWVLASLGGGAARLSSFVKVDPTSQFGTGVEVVPGVGDAYAVYVLSKVGDASVHVDGVSVFQANVGKAVFQDLDFAPPVTGATSRSPNTHLRCHAAGATFNHCRFSRSTTIAGEVCTLNNPGFFGATTLTCYATGGNVYGGGCRSTAVIPVNVGPGADLFLRLGFLVQAQAPNDPCLLVRGLLEVDDAGVLDWGAGTPEAVRTQDGGVLNSFLHSLWGTSAVAGSYGVYVRSGGVTYQATGLLATDRFKITGAAAHHFRLGDQTSVRAFDDAAGTFTAPRLLTWGNLAASVAAGGFGESVSSPSGGYYAQKNFNPH